MELIGMVVSGLFGGGVGLLGTLVSRVFGWLEEREKIRRLEVQNAHEFKMQGLQNEARVAEREHEYATAIVQTDAQMRTASYRHDGPIGDAYRWVNAVRALMRPLLTIVSCGLWGWVIYLGVIVFGDRGAYMEAIAQANFLATTTFVWWFGARDKQKAK